MPTLFKNKLLSQKYDLYFETGTAGGRSSKIALDLGFKKVFSCDIVKLKNKHLLDYENFFYENSDSVSFLKKHLKNLNQESVFFLDAHPNDFQPKDWPIWDELGLILDHHIKNHFIIIDDYDIISSKFPKKLETIISNSNKGYNFIGYSFNRFIDVLVAEPEPFIHDFIKVR